MSNNDNDNNTRVYICISLNSDYSVMQSYGGCTQTYSSTYPATSQLAAQLYITIAPQSGLLSSDGSTSKLFKSCGMI